MKQAYLSFLSSALTETAASPTKENPYGTIIHKTHGASFAVSVTKEHGMLLAPIKDPSAFDDLSLYLDDEMIPGCLSLSSPVPPSEVDAAYLEKGNHRIYSATIKTDGVTTIQTAFTFDGGIAILGTICAWESDEDSAKIGILRCLAHPDKMKVHKNTTTHGGLILRTLMDENKPIRSIRPTKVGEETKGVFSYALSVSPEIPCYAIEITTQGMGFGCQILSNLPACQAILLDSGEILCFDSLTKTSPDY